MTLRIYKYILASTFIASPITVQADSDIYIKICNDTEYLKCIGINTKNCIAANTKASNTCKTKYPYVPNRERDELIQTATKYGYCITEHYISYLGIDDVKFEKCAKYLEPIFDKQHKDMLKESEAFDKRFFEEDDPLHNYYN